MEESSDNFQDKILEFCKKNLIVLAFFLGGLTFLVFGFAQMVGNKNSASSSSFKSVAEVKGASTESKGSQESLGEKIKVDVEGKVANPGVYSVDTSARVEDALIAAGGLVKGADRNAINLAQRLIDGQKVYVPAVGEALPANTSQGSTVSQGSQGQSGVVSINSGSEQDLDNLPAIGPVTAQKIIDNRPYGALDDLVNKKAVGQTTFDKIKNLISL